MAVSETSPFLATCLATQYEPVDPSQHQTWSWTPFQNYGFARGIVSVPIVLAELHQTASTLPILFETSPGGGVLPVAVLRMGGQGPDVVSETGDWTGFYVPSVLRSYPFACGLPGTDHAGRVLLDPTSASLNQGATGTRLFDVAGAPTDDWQQVLTHMDSYQRLMDVTVTAAQALLKGKLLVPAQSLALFEDPIFEGFQIIDRRQFSRMPQHRLAKLFQTGAMELVHAHFTSLETVSQVKRLAKARRGALDTKPDKTSASGTQGFLDAMAIAYENQEGDNVPYDRGDHDV